MIEEYRKKRIVELYYSKATTNSDFVTDGAGNIHHLPCCENGEYHHNMIYNSKDDSLTCERCGEVLMMVIESVDENEAIKKMENKIKITNNIEFTKEDEKTMEEEHSKEYCIQYQTLKDSIRKKINWREAQEKIGEGGFQPTEYYDGFDMSGYGSSRYENMELLSRFKDYMSNKFGSEDDWRKTFFHYPLFWKGGGDIIRVGLGYSEGNSIDTIEDITGWSTEGIILRCIFLQNPDILIQMKTREEKIEEEIKLDLSDLIDENSTYEKTEIIKKFKRDYSLIQELKKKHNQCQICGFTFKKKNGENYNETHHIIPLSKNGKDQEINTLILCANCHRQLHYAKVDISNILQNTLTINGEVKIIQK